MKTFLEFMNEDLEADLSAYQARRAASGSQPPKKMEPSGSVTDHINDVANRRFAPRTVVDKPEPVSTVGANSPFADPSVKTYDQNKTVATVSPNKPYTNASTGSAVKSALAAKGYDQSGKRITAIPASTGVARSNIPVGSIQNTPARPAAPIPKARPAGVGSPQTFDKAFSAARSAGKSNFTFKGKVYNTQLKRK